MIDLDTASRLEFWPSREWLARKLSNPKRDRELWDCAAKMKSSWKTTVFSFIRDRCALFQWRLYHIEVSQRLSRTYLPGDSQNDPLVLLIFCAKSSSDDIGRRGVRMQRSMNMPMQMEGNVDRRPIPSPPRSPSRIRERPWERYRPFRAPPRSPSRDRDDGNLDLGGGGRGRARKRPRPMYYCDGSSSLSHERGRRSIPPNFERLRPRGVSETKQSDAEIIEIIDRDDNFEHYAPRRRRDAVIDSGDHYGYYAPRRHQMGNEINKRPSETKQSDAEIIDQILREYTTYGDSNAIPSPIEQASMNGRANAADGTSDAASRFGGDVAEDPPSRD